MEDIYLKRRYKVFISFILLISVILTSIILESKIQYTNTEVSKSVPIYRVKREDKAVSITFDINWAEKDEIFSILDVLDKYDVKATFFIMGGWINHSEENKEKLIKIKEGGHEIGNHSYKHPMFSNIDENRMREELEKTDKAIEETIGVKPNLFRFPSGDYSERSVNYINNMGYKCIQWDVDSVDWKELGAEIEYNRVMKGVKSGSIMLFHNNAKYTPGNLDRIINELISKGYSIIPVGELIYEDNYYIDIKGEQIKSIKKY
ncbi:MAG: polysaccharide deacetylase family protein [Clostridiales bacterium]|nr:polysaccharide deacetylase family protein [Clostridiales bacterium]